MWGKMVTKQDIWNKLNTLCEKIEEMSEELTAVQKTQIKLIGVFDQEKLTQILTQTNVQFKEILNQTERSLGGVRSMANELKGIVAMARAALDEGKKFTEMSELGNVLREVSGFVHEFGVRLERLGQISDKLLVSCEVKCSKGP